MKLSTASGVGKLRATSSLQFSQVLRTFFRVDLSTQGVRLVQGMEKHMQGGVVVVDGLEDGAQRLDDVGQADFGFRDLFGGLFGRLPVGLILGGFVTAVYGLGGVFLFLGRSRGDGRLGVRGPGFPGCRFGDVEETAHTASSVPTRT